MEITRATMGVFAALCIGAGAGGAYLATRGPAGSTTAEQTASVEPAADSHRLTGSVEQSEAVVSETAPAPAQPITRVPASSSAARPAQPAAATSRPAEPGTARTAQPVTAPPVSVPATADAPAPSPSREEAKTVTLPAPDPARPAEPPAPARPAEPPAPEFVDLVISPDSVIGLQVETQTTSESARVEDEVVARVTRDVRVGDRVAIPAGAKAHGEVTTVERGGKVRERARLGVRFTSIVLANGTKVPIETDTIYREGDAPTNESAAKIGGGAIGGAILGGILGGAKGAVLGGSVGAGAGTAAVMAGGRNAAVLPTGAPVTIRLVKPATVTVED